MFYPPGLLDVLEDLGTDSWSGAVYRGVIEGTDPTTPNRKGARWNPPGTAALYTSLERQTLEAELRHLLGVQVPPIRRRLEIVRMSVNPTAVVDLRDHLETVGIRTGAFGSDDISVFRRVGGAAAWLNRDGLLVPSVRAEGTNLVIFPDQLPPASVLDVLDSEVLTVDELGND